MLLESKKRRNGKERIEKLDLGMDLEILSRVIKNQIRITQGGQHLLLLLYNNVHWA